MEKGRKLIYNGIELGDFDISYKKLVKILTDNN
jgi:hypothetical protein